MIAGRARWALVAAGLVVVAAGTGVGLAMSGGSAPAVSRAAVESWRAQRLQPLIDQVGATLVYDVKPALDDLGSGKLAPARFRAEAAGWLVAIRQARTTFDSCRPAGRLGRIAAMYDAALGQYEQAINAMSEAAGAPPADRAAALKSAALVGGGADSAWNSADSTLNALARSVGIEVTVPVNAQAPTGCP